MHVRVSGAAHTGHPWIHCAPGISRHVCLNGAATCVLSSVRAADVPRCEAGLYETPCPVQFIMSFMRANLRASTCTGALSRECDVDWLPGCTALHESTLSQFLTAHLHCMQPAGHAPRTCRATVDRARLVTATAAMARRRVQSTATQGLTSRSSARMCARPRPTTGRRWSHSGVCYAVVFAFIHACLSDCLRARAVGSRTQAFAMLPSMPTSIPACAHARLHGLVVVRAYACRRTVGAGVDVAVGSGQG